MPRLALATAALAAVFAAAASAQSRHAFVFDAPQSALTFSGQAVVPPLPPQAIVGQPSNTFLLGGTLDLDLVLSPGGTVSNASLVKGGSATTIPPISAIVPNPIPGFPPLASINITGLQMAFFSTDAAGAPASFAVAGDGSFSRFVVGEILAGTASYTTPIFSGSIPLAGKLSPPQPLLGTLTGSSPAFLLTVPLAATFPFGDSSTGVTGSITLAGSVQADYRPLNSDVGSVSLASGGVQTLTVSTGGTLGNNFYLVVGSASGTTPGITLDSGKVLPLNFDSLLGFSLESANSGPFGNTFGALDALGKTTAPVTITIPTGLNPALAGVQLDFAYAVIKPANFGLPFVSNPEPLLLTP